MSELTVGSFRDRALELEKQRLKDLKALPIEERLSLLEADVSNEMDILYNKVLPELDEQISRTLHEAYAVGDKANQAYSDSVGKLSELERLIRTCLQATVNELIAKSNSTIVTNALREALKSTIVKTRPATRSELQSGENVVVVRQVSPAELRQQ